MNWILLDDKRGDKNHLFPDLSDQEKVENYAVTFTDSGFSMPSGWNEVSAAGNFVYVAIAAPVIDTLSAEDFAEQKLKFATYENREAVKQGEEAMNKREKMVEGLRESGMSQEQIDKLIN